MLRHAHANGNPEFTRGTIAVGLPPKEMLIDMLSRQLDRAYFKVGATFVHPKENFNKQIGRTIALENAENQPPKFATLTKIEIRDQRWVLHFSTIVPDTRPGKSKYTRIEFGVTFTHKSENTGLEYAIFVE